MPQTLSTAMSLPSIRDRNDPLGTSQNRETSELHGLDDRNMGYQATDVREFGIHSESLLLMVLY